MKKANILIVDDDLDVLTAVRLLLKKEVNSILTEKNPEQIPHLLDKHKIDLILLDMNYKSAVNSGNEGLYWLGRIKKKFPSMPVIMITAYGAIDLAVQSLKQGAADFIVKPWKNDQLMEVITENLQKQDKRTPVKSNAPNIRSEIIGTSDVMDSVFQKLKKIAPTDANVLILGENGTGKDLIAKALHQLSQRKDQAFIKVDVGALTETLFESELFGHKKGAFTDAREDRTGRIESANAGTLFLDEIGNISLQQQAKLLTVLQNRQVTPLGSNRLVNVDIRLICATNVPLSVLSDESRFRKDLIYRINTVEIQVPPLRERGTDILLLAEHFIKQYSDKYGKSVQGLNDQAQQKLMHYSFPGNVRELQYAIERAVIMADGPELLESDIHFSILEQPQTISGTQQEEHNLEALERTTILKVIEKHHGNISKASKELGLTRTALYRRLSKYNI